MNYLTEYSLMAMRQAIAENKANSERLRALRQMAREARLNAARLAKELSLSAKRKSLQF